MSKGTNRSHFGTIIELEKEFVKQKKRFTQIEFTDNFYIYKVECNDGYWYECFLEKIGNVQEYYKDELGNSCHKTIPNVGKVNYPRDQRFMDEKDAFECETIDECHEFIKEYYNKQKKRHLSPLNCYKQ